MSASLALVAALSLPQAGGHPCATMALREAAHAGFPAMASALFERPWAEELASSTDSAAVAVRVHLGVGVDAARGALALGALEAAWAAQVDGAGFDPPLPDGAEGGDGRLDVYLVPLPPGTGALTVAQDDAGDDDRRASPAFLKVDPNLNDALLEVYLHHEFQHALQFALDTRESALWSEATAAYWEVRARPDVDEWQAAVPDFQRHPQAPIFTDAAAFAPFAQAGAPLLEYGAVLFVLYLDGEHGDGAGTLLADLWRGSVQADAVPDNEPDWLDAVAAHGLDVGALVVDFVGWRALVGPLAVADDGPAVALGGAAALAVQSVTASTLDGEVELTDEDSGPFQLSCLVRQVEVPGAVTTMPVRVRAEATLADQTLAVAALVTVPGSGVATRAVLGAGSAVDADVEAPAGALVQVALCDTSPADADEAPVPRPIRFSLLRTDVDWPDAGPAVDDAGVPEPDAGPPVPPGPVCACQSAGGPTNLRKGMYVLGLMVSVVMLVVRATRARKRRHLYKSTSADDGNTR